jgi:hypothetical protein
VHRRILACRPSRVAIGRRIGTVAAMNVSVTRQAAERATLNPDLTR